MAEAARVFELERPIQEVWRVYSDFEVWSSWFDVNALIVSRLHRFQWLGAPGPGASIAVEVNGARGVEWLAKEWDPPLRYRVVGAHPGAAAFSFAATLTRQTDVSTLVDLKLVLHPLGRLGRLW